MSIPKIVHQTWKNRELHPALRACVESFHFLNPGWEIRYYDDDDCMIWLQAHCPHLLRNYISLPTGIHRADVFRLLILHYEGGVYADIDIECIRPLDELIGCFDPTKTVYLTRDHPVHERIHYSGRAMYMNDFIVAAPGDYLIEKIINWALSVPLKSSTSARAVLETGPGLFSSVIEMLGGVEEIDGLEIVPTSWIHPIPDMNCRFDESANYRALIESRGWLSDKVFVVHYWFHTWTGNGKNTLLDYSEFLLSSFGEQVERRLQWALKDDTSDANAIVAASIAEFTEMGGGLIVLCDDPATADLLDRVLFVLELSGIRPKIVISHFHEGRCDVGRIQAIAGSKVDIVEFEKTTDVIASFPGEGLLVVSSDKNSNFRHIEDWLRQKPGFLLGRSVDWAEPIASFEEIVLSESLGERCVINSLVHFFPNQGLPAENTQERLGAKGFSIRCWSLQELSGIVADRCGPNCRVELMSEQEVVNLASLHILADQGGVIFEGDIIALLDQIEHTDPTVLVLGSSAWLLACSAGCQLLQGIVAEWRAQNLHGISIGLREFIRSRVYRLRRDGKVFEVKVVRYVEDFVGT